MAHPDQTDAIPDNGTSEYRQKPLAPIELESRYEATLIDRALRREAMELGKLAKKNAEEGRAEEGRSILADAGHIELRIRPRVTGQQWLAFPTTATLDKAIRSMLAGHVRHAFAGLSEIESKEDLDDVISVRREELLRDIAATVVDLTTATARAGHTVGRMVREYTDERIVLDALAEVRTDAGT